MNLSANIELKSGNRYIARCAEPFALTAEGATREEALGNLRRLVGERLGAEATPVLVEVAVDEDPWRKLQGMYDPADPQIREWLEIIAQNRRKLDAEEREV